ncbi:MAG: CRISPR-associated protein Cas4 [Deltaproteobacteria bacterium RIFCSPLOWO2_12_FULL_43_16]|nr:MAG: CRISPR-associated protein Cas4 [Deltaproteobacteria bacterium GWA2_43_19]OGQ11038.1 MAG: CRISPR-associated protein Cas4 [Deltaproteobacteria bacterium RIFCSPHIGHO2_02_FULL_43_33]OGQ57169.1 MAG: CRISPR-associated protein Cas4 [Deltaproteobacteria bacterium RIFCSPLOWO2_12_FULL_43_16]HBR17947.1 CRISPR-associated protein Cas4 [Deltaproteobacteria bacterium]
MEAQRLILPISTVMESIYCPRNAWYAFVGERRNMAKSVHFTEAVHAHRAVDESTQRIRTDCKQITGMYIYSNKLGLTGRADTVEWLYGIPIPVETKTGAIRDFENFRVQIALQALCLEEMFNVNIPYGEIFFCETMRRHEIAVDEDLRTHSTAIVVELRERFLSFDINRFQRVNDHRCPKCQYLESCLPPSLEL